LATCCEPNQHPERAGQQARLVELLGAGVRPCVPRKTVALGEGAEMEFAWIPPGSFLMGSPPEEEERYEDEAQHQVVVTHGFWLATTPVTQAQWGAVLNSIRPDDVRPQFFASWRKGKWEALRDRNPSKFKGEDRPVEHVSWNDCEVFCTMLGQRDGTRYRLPTEAEWEYACRAGTVTAYCSGSGLAALKQVGWCSYDGKWGSAKATRPVASFQPNGWGLFDMHGNVGEWCQDRCGPYYSEGDSLNQSHCVVRGGSWFESPRICRSAKRGRQGPGHYSFEVGFRVVLCPD
jgi:formylglycine-generating enzyme required for sulfatase activity